MPDDNLFPTEGEPTSSAALPEGTQPLAAPVTQQDLIALIHQFVEPNANQMARISQTQAELSQALQAVAQRVGMGGSNGSPEPTVDVSDFITDPTRHITEISRGVVDSQVREQIAPLLAQLVQQTHRDTVTRQEQAVDREFGEGAWKTHFYPELKPIFDRTQKEAPSQLGNVEAIQRAVDTVKGMKFEVLAKAREEAVKSNSARSEAERNSLLEIVQSNLTGGITRSGGKAVLSADMKDYIEREFRATGTRPDESSFLASVNSGSTYADWLAAQKPAGKKGGN